MPENESKKKPESQISTGTIKISLISILKELVANDNNDNLQFSGQNIDALFALPHWKKNIVDGNIAPIFWAAVVWKIFGVTQSDHKEYFSSTFLKTIFSAEKVDDNNRGIYYPKESENSPREVHVRPGRSGDQLNGKFTFTALIQISATFSHEVAHAIADLVYQDGSVPPSKSWSKAVSLTKKLIDDIEAKHSGHSIESIELSNVSHGSRPVLTLFASVFKNYSKYVWSAEFIARITESIIKYGSEATWQAFTDEETRLAVQAAYQSYLTDCQSTLSLLSKNPYVGRIINGINTGRFQKNEIELPTVAAENFLAIIQSEELHRIVRIGNPRVIKEFLSNPAQVEKFFNYQDKNEKTPFQLLVENHMPAAHKIEVLQYLIEKCPEKRQEISDIIKILEAEKRPAATPWGSTSSLFITVPKTVKPVDEQPSIQSSATPTPTSTPSSF